MGGQQRTSHVKQLSEAAGAVVVRVRKLDTMKQLPLVVQEEEGGGVLSRGVGGLVTLRLLSGHVVKVVRQTPVASQRVENSQPH